MAYEPVSSTCANAGTLTTVSALSSTTIRLSLTASILTLVMLLSLAILAVNVGESGSVARAFAEKLPIAFTVLLDREGSITRAWGARVLPASYLIGPDGAIRYSYYGDLNWSSDEVRGRIESLVRKAPQSAAR